MKMHHNKESAKLLAGSAVEYLNINFEAKNLHIQLQKPLEERKHLIAVISSDDQHIINCFLQVKQKVPHVIFLTVFKY